MTFGLTEQVSDEQYSSMFNINGLHVVYLAKAMLNQLLERRSRSAIVIVSSVASYLIHSDITTYCTTKAMVRTFGQALHHEVKAKIDVLAWTPGYILSNMAPTFMRRDGVLFFRTTAIEAVKVMHGSLGRTDTTCGTFGHRLTRFFGEKVIPYRWNCIMKWKIERARNDFIA